MVVLMKVMKLDTRICTVDPDKNGGKMVKKLRFGKRSFEPNIRMLYDLKDVLYEQENTISTPNSVAYYFYRGLFLNSKDKEIMDKNNIQYDVTVIPQNKYGVELAKTKGHYHSIVNGTNITYPEMYQVISGKALYLLQKLENEKVVDVVAVKAVAGDIVIIPPNYGHITINNSDTTLKMCNWISVDVKANYKAIEQKKGGSYFKLEDGILMQNNNYENLPKPRFLKVNWKAHFGVEGNMYELIRKPKLLEFLNRPQFHSEIFEFINTSNAR